MFREQKENFKRKSRKDDNIFEQMKSKQILKS